MSDARFIPKGFTKQLAHLMEECAEVIHAGAKIQRFGRKDYRPNDDAKGATNEEALLAEMLDVEEAIARLRKTITGKRTLRGLTARPATAETV